MIFFFWGGGVRHQAVRAVLKMRPKSPNAGRIVKQNCHLWRVRVISCTVKTDMGSDIHLLSWPLYNKTPVQCPLDHESCTLLCVYSLEHFRIFELLLSIQPSVPPKLSKRKGMDLSTHSQTTITTTTTKMVRLRNLARCHFPRNGISFDSIDQL
jgi:hypothetical protein